MIARFIYGLVILSLWSMSVSSPVSAQQARLSRFTAAAVDEKVLLDWVVAAGATCDGIGIYRGADTVGMTLIHYIPGVCGDLARPVNYTFLDSFPLYNQYNYYRLELGPRVFTDFIRLALVDLDGQLYQFRPHPVQDEAHLYLKDDIQLTVNLRVYDSRGQLRLSTTFNESSFRFSTINFENGLYFFVVSRADGSFQRRGKLLVQR